MSTSVLSNLPMQAATGMADLAGRGASWCIARMMRSPMGSTAFLLVSGLTMVAAANALFLQEGRHPAPMFVTADYRPAQQSVASPPPVAPVIVSPVERPAELATITTQSAQPQSQATTPAGQPPAPAIGNADIAEMQEKLKAMGMFEGTIDGFYGPKTADAIRAFEQRFGLPRTGAASPQVIEAVRNAPLSASQATDPLPTAPVTAQPPSGDLGALIAEMSESVEAAPVQPMPEPVAPVETIASVEPLEIAAQAPAPVSAAVPPALDRELVSEIQRGLLRLGFLQAPVDGVAGESTALAIRKFQIFNNYPATGEVSTAVVDMLVAAGAYM